jgi:hypothetical protein
MGTARWSPADWDSYVSVPKSKSAKDIFSSFLDPDLEPKDIVMRESCDSKENPLSTPIIVAVDETGSMGILAENLIRKGLGVLLEEIYERKPVTDPHIMCMAVGDAWCDRAPLQVTQFEADIRLAKQLSKFYIEGNGGGNSFESYNLPWYFAATRTKCDAFLKRKKKGYLFTVGDEPPPPVLRAEDVQKFLGHKMQRDISTADVLKMATRSWEVFHIIIEEGSFYRQRPDQTSNEWRKLLNQRALLLCDHTKLAELIVSTIEVNEGADPLNVASSWSGNTALVLRDSLCALSNLAQPVASGKGVTRL